MKHNNWRAILSLLLMGVMLAGCVAPVAAPGPTSAPLVETPLPPTPVPSNTSAPEPTRTPLPVPSNTSAPEPTRTPLPVPSNTSAPKPTKTAPLVGVSGRRAQFSCKQERVIEIRREECDALVAIFLSTNGERWKNNSGWLTTNTPCSWYGVTCRHGNVTRLVLDNNGLSGSIPVPGELRDHLPYLEVLSVGGNPELAWRGKRPTATSEVPTMPHPIAGLEDQCLTCHGPEGAKPAPESHAAFTVDICQTCHQPGVETERWLEPAAAIASPPNIPHPIAGIEDQCLTCHVEGGLKRPPENHVAFTVDMCQTCHEPAQ